MGKKLILTILWSVVVLLGAPLVIMGYAMVFGHSFSSTQLNSAGGLLMGATWVIFAIIMLIVSEVLK